MKTVHKHEISTSQNEQDGRFRQSDAVFVDTDAMFEENKHEGMYEALQIKLGKTNLELHKIIAAL